MAETGPPEVLVTEVIQREVPIIREWVGTLSGVDHMNYMYSLNASNGSMQLTVDFDTNIDQVLTQMRESQAHRNCLPASKIMELRSKNRRPRRCSPFHWCRFCLYLRAPFKG